MNLKIKEKLDRILLYSISDTKIHDCGSIKPILEFLKKNYPKEYEETCIEVISSYYITIYNKIICFYYVSYYDACFINLDYDYCMLTYLTEEEYPDDIEDYKKLLNKK